MSPNSNDSKQACSSSLDLDVGSGPQNTISLVAPTFQALEKVLLACGLEYARYSCIGGCGGVGEELKSFWVATEVEIEFRGPRHGLNYEVRNIAVRSRIVRKIEMP